MQAFSLKHSRLLDSYDVHPSPPSIFALSCDFRLLLSTSARPPTLHLCNLAANTPPFLIRPQCSSSAVVAAAFHPERQGVFVLAYADGNVAVYDAMRIFKRNGKIRDNNIVPGESAGEIASIKGIHTPITRIRSGSLFTVDKNDPSAGEVSVTANAEGVTSVALLPGRRATAITVGADGKCCVIDFTQPTKKKALLLKSWHLRRPATSVSVIFAREKVIAKQAAAYYDQNLLTNEDYYIAIGRQDGKVLLFDLNGKQLAHQQFDTRKSRVIEVEWAKVEIPPIVPLRSDSIFAVNNDINGKNENLEETTILTSRRRPLSSPIEQDSLFDFTTPRKSLGFTPSSAPSQAPEYSVMLPNPSLEPDHVSDESGYSNAILNRPDFSSSNFDLTTKPSAIIQSKRSGETLAIEIKTNQSSLERAKSENTSYWDTTNSPARSESHIPPPIPPRPDLRPSGRSYIRRVQRAREAANRIENRTSSSGRRISISSSRSYRRISPCTLLRAKVLMGPRPFPKRSRTASLQAKIEAEDASDSSRFSSNVLTSLPNGSSASTKESTKSYKTASSHPQSSQESERSDETIVDWSPAASQRPLPTLVEYPSVNLGLQKSVREKDKRNNSLNKEHISVSSFLSTSSEDAISDWPNRPKYKAPAVADATPSEMTSRADETGMSLTSGQRSAILESATALVLAGGHYDDAGNLSPSTSPVRRIKKEEEEDDFIKSVAIPPPPPHSTPLPAMPVLRNHSAAVATGEPVQAQAQAQEDNAHQYACTCGVEIRTYLEQAFARLREENAKNAERLREDVRGLFLEQRRWVVDFASK